MSLLLAAAALCVLPPRGAPEPTPPSEAEKARVIATANRKIVSGTVLRGTTRDGMLRFKVQRVYKGDIKRGTVIAARASHGFYSMQPCPGMIAPPPVFPGVKGTIAFNEVPAPLNFVQANWFDEMVATGLIARR